MAKTQLAAGTTVMADFLNSIFGGYAKNIWVAGTAYALGALVRPTTPNSHYYRCIVAGTSHASTEPTWPTAEHGTITDGTATWQEFTGHHHDGLACDGSAGKIHPYEEIRGVTEGEFNLSFAGFGTAQTVTVRYRKEAAIVAGKPAYVQLCIPGVMATSTGNSLGDSGGNVPAALRPTTTIVEFPMIVYDNSVATLGRFVITDAGNVLVYLGSVSGASIVYSDTGFTGSGSKGFSQLIIRYPVY